MFQFFRKYAAVFVWVIVIAFLLTLGAGTMLGDGVSSYFKQNNNQRDQSLILQSGQVGVTRPEYSALLNSELSKFIYENNLILTFDEVETLRFNLLSSLLSEQILLKTAEKQGVKVSKNDWKLALQEVLIRYDLKDKKALKRLLEEKNRSYEDFKTAIKKNIKQRKFLTFLQEMARVDDLQENDFFSKYELSVLYFKTTDQGLNEAKLDSYIVELQQGGAFNDMAVSLRDEQQFDVISQQGWFFAWDLTRPVLDVVSSLDEGEVSHFFPYIDGYFIVKLIKKEDIDDRIKNDQAFFDAAKQRFLNTAISTYSKLHLELYPIQFFDHDMKAFYAKMQGDFETALNAYQRWSSSDISNPLPHYFLAQLYFIQNKLDLCEEQLLKADIKRDLVDAFVFPELDLLFSQFYSEKSDLIKEKTYLNKTLESVGFKYRLLQLLKEKFEVFKDDKALTFIDEKLTSLDEFMKKTEDDEALMSSD